MAYAWWQAFYIKEGTRETPDVGEEGLSVSHILRPILQAECPLRVAADMTNER
jgi:hypothetical protein